MIFTWLGKIRALEKEAMPWIESMQDRDIVLAIGAAHENGHHLNFKQLTLLGFGAPATLRRRLSRLVELGYVEKRLIEGDGRSAAYAISPRWMEHFGKLGGELKSVAYENIVQEVYGVRKAKKGIICQAKDCNTVANLLRQRLTAFGSVGDIRLTCTEARPRPLLTMVELQGDPQSAAADIGGVVIGTDLVCASWETHADFRCSGEPADGICMGAGDMA